MEEPQQAASRARFNIRSILKKVLIPVGIVIAIYVVYQFIGPDKTANKGVEFVPQTSTSTTKPTTETTASASTLDQAVTTSLARNEMALETQVNQLQSAQAQSSAQITTLINEYQNLADKYTALQSQLVDIRSGINAVSMQLAQMQSAAKEVKKVEHKPAAAAPKITYTLKALVPGRAWLQASNNTTVTVKVGDQLAGYGTINAINTSQGWVATSSGKYITYGADDA